MKNFLCAALVLTSLPAVSLPLATTASAQTLDRSVQPLDRSVQPIDRSNYLLYSYRHHYRAYGINSLTDGSLPPDEVYIDPCYKWVSTPRGMRKKFVCRS